MKNSFRRLRAGLAYRRELLKHALAGIITLRTFFTALPGMPSEVPAKDGSMLWVIGDIAMREEMDWRYRQYIASRAGREE